MPVESVDAQATLVPTEPKAPDAGKAAVNVKRLKPPVVEAEPLAHYCHEVVCDNVRGSENYHVCTVRCDESPYMHLGTLHACPCGFVWGHANDGKWKI